MVCQSKETKNIKKQEQRGQSKPKWSSGDKLDKFQYMDIVAYYSSTKNNKNHNVLAPKNPQNIGNGIFFQKNLYIICGK